MHIHFMINKYKHFMHKQHYTPSGVVRIYQSYHMGMSIVKCFGNK